jgi:hypothetical protein
MPERNKARAALRRKALRLRVRIRAQTDEAKRHGLRLSLLRVHRELWEGRRHG